MAERIRSMVSILTEEELRVMRLHYKRGYDQREVGARIGLDQPSVSRLIDGAIAKLAAAKNFTIDWEKDT